MAINFATITGKTFEELAQEANVTIPVVGANDRETAINARKAVQELYNELFAAWSGERRLQPTLVHTTFGMVIPSIWDTAIGDFYAVPLPVIIGTGGDVTLTGITLKDENSIDVTGGTVTLDLIQGGRQGATLTGEAVPVGASLGTLGFVSSVPAVASVDPVTGVIAALTTGNTVITVSSGSISETVTVEVVDTTVPDVLITGITPSGDSLGGNAGDGWTATATVGGGDVTIDLTAVPSSASLGNATSSDGDTDVATSTITAGQLIITPVSAGTSVITVADGSGSVTVDITVTVS